MKTASPPQKAFEIDPRRRPDLVYKTISLANDAERIEAYDFHGRLRCVEEPDDSQLHYSYDDAGQLIRARHSSGEVVHFSRTPEEIKASSDRTETCIRLDERGYPVQLVVRADGHEWTIEYRRDSRGRVLATRYPQSTDWLITGEQLRCGGQVYAELRLPYIRFANGTSMLEEWSEDKPPRLRKIAHFAADGATVWDQDYTYDPHGKLSRAGVQSFSYDDQGRLIQCDDQLYKFDAEGRLIQAGDRSFGYGPAPFVVKADSDRFEYDPLGRRAAVHSAAGISRYTYNLFGQLASVELPDGTRVVYLYDGFGRLIGRQLGAEKTFYIVDLEGHRIAECDAKGTVTRSYLWLGPQCVGVVNGVCGHPLTRSFHRVHGGNLVGVAQADGSIQVVAGADPYGADVPLLDGTPGYACLFGDSLTGLLHAGSRWLDPRIGQFLSADSWFGTSALKQMAPPLRQVLDTLPGGTGRLLSRQSAYDWCARDPVNYSDPNGHNFVGLIWSCISTLMWSMQVTSISLQIEALSLLLFILTSPVALFSSGFREGFWHSISPFNSIAPVLGSTRLMVPLALPLNSFMSAGGDVFTMGNVIWTQGDNIGNLERTSQRDLIMCANAATYQAMTNRDAIAHLTKGEDRIARSITFIAGKALHIANQIPKGFATEGLLVTEFRPTTPAVSVQAFTVREAPFVQLAAPSDQAVFAANDSLRIRSGSDFLGRVVSRLQGTRNLILDLPLDAPGTTDFSRIEVVKLVSSGAALAAQTGGGFRVTASTLADLRKGDGLAIENTGATPVTRDLRIVTQVLLTCPVAALPGPLLGQALTVELMDVVAATIAQGNVTANNQVTTAASEAGRFKPGQAVRLRKTGGTDVFAAIAAVDNGANLLTFTNALPVADFPNGTAVTVNLLTVTKTFSAEASSAPGTQVTLTVDQPGSPAQNNVLRVRAATVSQGGEIRLVNAPPTVAADLNKELSTTHTSNLSVERLIPLSATLRDNASAPIAHLRFTILSSNPYAVGDVLHFSQSSGTEEAVEKIFLNLPGNVVELEEPIRHLLDPTRNVEVNKVAPTGVTTADGSLEEALVLIPSDPDEEPITRRRALEAHEMRHVWQYSILGPFFLFLPLPWLISLGWSPASASTGGKWTRYISAGLTDDLLALIAWGIGKGFGKIPSESNLNAEVFDEARKVIAFAADTPDPAFAPLSKDSPCEVRIGDYASYNFIDEINVAAKRITLRFALEADKFQVHARVSLSVSPFENMRRTMNQVFGGIFVSLWQDHVPPGWGKAFSRLLNRDSWFALPLGLFPLAFMRAGFTREDQKRVHFEQDAGYHSGDLYTNFAVGEPNEIYAGQFCRVMGFMQGRGAQDAAVGISDIDFREFIKIETPSGGTLTPTQKVPGSLPSSGSQVLFGDNYFMRMSDKVENVVGAFFAASFPGEYVLHVTDELTEDVVHFLFIFSAGFVEKRKIKVKALGVDPLVSAAAPLFETEQIRLRITGDPVATYGLRYVGTPPTPALILDPSDSLRVTVPLLGAAAPATHQLEITATYKATDGIFHGAGQVDPLGLTAAELTNVCQSLPLDLAVINAPTIGPVAAGSRHQFPMPIAPASVRVTSAIPAGATTNASVVNGTGRPAQLTFFAPNAVSSPTVVTVEMIFGSGAITKNVPLSITVNP